MRLSARHKVLFHLAIAVLLFFAACLQPSLCRAFGVEETRFGLLYHDVGIWGGSSQEGGTDINGELIFSAAAPLLAGVIRPNLGVSVNTSGGTSKLYMGGFWQYRWQGPWFVDLGLSLAIHNGETRSEPASEMNQLGSRILFRLSCEAGFSLTEHHQLSLLFDHMSNAYLADPNEGLDTLGLRYGYRF